MRVIPFQDSNDGKAHLEDSCIKVGLILIFRSNNYVSSLYFGLISRNRFLLINNNIQNYELPITVAYLPHARTAELRKTRNTHATELRAFIARC
jgi:hypothetical protein